MFRRLVKARLINELTTPYHFPRHQAALLAGVIVCALRLCVPYGSVCVKRGTYGKAESG